MLTLQTDLPERRLTMPPLARCLMQVRYSHTPELIDDDTERKLAQAFPDLPVRGSQITTTFGAPMPPETLRTFSSVSEDRKVTVGASFVAYETSNYQGRTEFVSHARDVLQALTASARVGRIERVGVRYTNFFAPLERARQCLRPELLGVLDQTAPEVALRQQILQVTIQADEARGALVVSGKVAAGETPDPSLPPRTQESWVLDIDSFDTTRQDPSQMDAVIETVQLCAARAYGVFSWSAAKLLEEEGK